MENNLIASTFTPQSSKYIVRRVKFALKHLREKLILLWTLIGCFFGNPKDAFSTLMMYMDRKCMNPDIYRLKIFTTDLAVVHKSEDIQAVLNKNICMNKSIFYMFWEHAFGQGMITATVRLWKHQRRILTPAFQPQALENLLPIFNDKSKALISKLETLSDTGKRLDLWDHLVSTSLDIGWVTVVGLDCNIISDEEKKEFQHAVLKAMEIDFYRITQLWMYNDAIFNFYAKVKGYTKIFDIVQQLPNKVISHKRKLREMDVQKKNEERSFLDRILEANEKENLFSDKQIRDQMVTLIFASAETTAITNGFVLLMLAMNQDIQERVYNEIAEVIGENTSIEKKHLDHLVNLEQCINETLRLFPPVPIFGRHTKDPLPLNGGNLPAKSQIAICPFSIHRSTKYYSNPLKWNPDNFTAEENGKRSIYTFLPFSRGPRMCIGARYAMMSMKISLSLILREFKVTTDFKLNQIELSMDSILRSVHGFPVEIHSRNKKEIGKLS